MIRRSSFRFQHAIFNAVIRAVTCMMIGTATLATVAAGIGFTNIAVGQDSTDDEIKSRPQDLLYFHEDQPVIMRFHLKLRGKPFDQPWNKYIAGLHGQLDQNSDGHLNAEELTRADKVDSVQLKSIVSRSDIWQADVSPIDRRISVHELQEFLIRRQLGPFQSLANTYQTGNSNSAGEALFKAMDANEDRQLEAAEFENAAKHMRRKDMNDDDSYSQYEFTMSVGTTVPSTSRREQEMAGSFRLLSDTSVQQLEILQQFQSRYVDGLSRRDFTFSADDLGLNVEHLKPYDLDKNERLDFDEMRRFLKDPVPSIELSVDLDPELTHSAAVTLIERTSDLLEIRRTDDLVSISANGVQIALNRNQTGIKKIRQYIGQQFTNADRDGNDYLSKFEASRNQVFSGSFAELDSDGDEKLFKEEVDKAFDSRTEIAVTRTRATVTDRGRDFFQILDADRNRQLSMREFKNAAKQIPLWDFNADDSVQQDEVPRMFQLSLGPGLPEFQGMKLPDFSNPTTTASVSGPVWFQRWDRNQDTELSRREFPGTRREFERLDKNNDQVIDSLEAGDAKKP